MNTDNSGSLEEQIGELRSRVRRLEEALDSYGIVITEGALPPAAAPAIPQAGPPPVAWTDEIARRAKASEASAASMPAAALHEARPMPPITAPNLGVYTAEASVADARSLESRIGSHWFNRIGILAVLIAVVWFLKLAMDNHWIGPLGRVMIGLAAGAAATAWSERFRSHGYAIFSYGLKAIGSGTLYLSLWAAFSLYHLMPSGAAFAAMIAVTAFNGYMAWVQDAELLGLYAIVGAISTPILISTGVNHEITLFTYLLMLDVAVLVLVALRPWSRLLFAAYLGSVLLFAGWWLDYYSESQFGWTAFFLSCFFLIFAFAPRLVRVDLEDGAPHSAWDHLALAMLPVANAALGFIAFYALFDWFKSEWAGAWLAVGFAAFYLLLLRLPGRSGLRESPALLSSLHLTAAVVFLTIAIPLKAHDRWLTTGWLVEGAALLWVARRTRLLLLRALALLCLVLGFVALVVVNPPASTTPIFNARFASYCLAIAVFGIAAWIAFKAKDDGPTQDSAAGSGIWPMIAAGAVLTVNILILLAIGWEIHSYWWILRWNGEPDRWVDCQMYAQFTYSAWFMLFGAVLLCVGFWRRSAFLRWQALVLLAVTIGKVFLSDMSQLSQGYRILSFLGLGALLLAVSFVYQRDWLNLRAGNGGKDEA